MKKKLFCILLGLFLSVGFMRPSCAVTLTCKMTVTTVCAEYFAKGNTIGDYWNAYFEWKGYLYELNNAICQDREVVMEDEIDYGLDEIEE